MIIRACRPLKVLLVMKSKKTNTLITSVGRRVELLKAFHAEYKNLCPFGEVFVADASPSLSPACNVGHRVIASRRVADTDYVEHLLNACIENRIGLLVPTIDSELEILAENRSLFLDHGINIVISDSKLVRSCRDKRKTALLFAELDIATPKIYPKSEISFPCFVKPYDGSRSEGACSLSNPDDLNKSVLQNEKMIFMELVDESYQEFTADLYYDDSGVLKCLVPRKRLEVRAGEVSKSITCRGRFYDDLRERLSILPGARGCLTLQMFVSPCQQDILAIEINPRFGGGYPLTYAAGGAFPRWLIQEYFFNRSVDFFDDWPSNLLMLRYDAHVLVASNG